MKENDLYSEISSIRHLMERSTKFISLSGLSGVMAGIYALIGAGLAYNLIYIDGNTDGYMDVDHGLTVQLLLIAAAVLLASIVTCFWLTTRNARRAGQSVWNQSSQLLLKSGALPLLTGGCFVLLLLLQGYFAIIAASCLIFYGLALVAGSQYTFGDVKWLGICEIGLGLLATLLPNFGLLLWALGFGVLHIVYGAVMHFKYEREDRAD